MGFKSRIIKSTVEYYRNKTLIIEILTITISVEIPSKFEIRAGAEKLRLFATPQTYV